MFGIGKKKKGNLATEQEKKAMIAAERIKAAGYAGLLSGGLYK